MCLNDLLVVFRVCFVGILQVIGKYFESSIKNWILSAEYLCLYLGLLLGICRCFTWFNKKLRYPGRVDLGAPSCKNQRSR